MELNNDFKEFIELLNEHGVKYLVIGEYAVNFHGYPRYTKDIDFWLWMTEENISKLLVAIKKFGFGGLKLEIADFMAPENIVQLGYEPYRIDLLVDVTGVNFEECFERRIESDLDGVEIKFLSLQDLIDAQKASKRKRFVYFWAVRLCGIPCETTGRTAVGGWGCTPDTPLKLNLFIKRCI